MSERKTKWTRVVTVALACAATLGVCSLRSGPHPTPELPERAAAGPHAPPGASARNGAAARHAGAWLREEDPPGPLELAGLVVDEAGAPVAGAEVTLQTQPQRLATTGADGAWSFKDLLPRPYRIDARKDDAFGQLVHVLPQAAPRALTIRLALGATVRVRTVAAATGAPLAGVLVQIADVGSSATLTDDAGWARFRGAAPVSAFVVAASKEGFATARRMVSAGLAGGGVRVFHLELAAALSVSGRVVDESGRALADAAVVAAAGDGGVPVEPARDGVRTDARGAFTLGALAAGTVTIRAFHPSFRAGGAAVVSLVPDAPSPEVVIALRRAVTVRGRVVDGHGRPAAWAEVHAYPGKQPLWNGAGARHLVADGEGAFRIDGLPPTSVALLAGGAAAATARPREVDLSANRDVDDVKLVLDLDGFVAGAVVDASGAPVAGATVVCRPADARTTAVRCPGDESTDAQGRFRIGGLPGATFVLAAIRPGGAHPAAEVTAHEGDADVRLVAGEVGAIAGRVRLADGTIPAGARVELQPGAGLAAPIGADGAFALGGLDAGSYSLLVLGDFALKKVDAIRLAAGQKRDLGVVEVERGRTLRGTVVDAAGAPVADARVIAGSGLTGADVGEGLGANLGAQATLTDEHGEFTLAGVPPAATVIVASQPRRGRSEPAPLPGNGDASALRLALVPAASVEGTVPGIGSTESCFVSLEPAGPPGLRYGARCGAHGRYRIDGVTRGDYRAEVQGPPATNGLARSITVAAGQALRLDF
jgi:protocatechuate 3,4-dioxygenase beta subunit